MQSFITALAEFSLTDAISGVDLFLFISSPFTHNFAVLVYESEPEFSNNLFKYNSALLLGAYSYTCLIAI